MITMCDECKCQDQELEQNANTEELQYELEEVQSQEEILPVIQMDFADYDEDKFYQGIQEASYYAGFYTACKNAGMMAVDIVNILLNKENIDFNLKATKMNADMNLEVSKNQSIVADKNAI